ncbi:sigma factor, partial [Streptomyces sp. NPDC002491]
MHDPLPGSPTDSEWVDPHPVDAEPVNAEPLDADRVDPGVTQAFHDHRELLFSLVYNILGSVVDTEDVLQETWLSWAARHRAPDAERVDHPRAYLVRIA